MTRAHGMNAVLFLQQPVQCSLLQDHHSPLILLVSSSSCLSPCPFCPSGLAGSTPLHHQSNIRHDDFRASVRVSRSGYPPWILKRGGLESSGRIPSSLYWKTKRIAFIYFFRRKKIFFKKNKKKMLFP